MMILLILFNDVLKNGQQGIISVLLNILFTTGPFLLMLAVIGFIMYLIIFYQEKINLGNISSSYYTFSNLAIILFDTFSQNQKIVIYIYNFLSLKWNKFKVIKEN